MPNFGRARPVGILPAVLAPGFLMPSALHAAENDDPAVIGEMAETFGPLHANSGLGGSTMDTDRARTVPRVPGEAGAAILIAGAVSGRVIDRPGNLPADRPLKMPQNPEGLSPGADGSALRIVTDS